MEQLIGNIEALIMMYAPIVFCYVTQVASLVSSYKKAKALDIKSQTKPLTDEIDRLIKTVEACRADSNELRTENASLIRALSQKDHVHYEHGSKELKERLR